MREALRKDLFMNEGRQDQLAKLNVIISPSEKLDTITCAFDRKTKRECNGPIVNGQFTNHCTRTLNNGTGPNGNFCCNHVECKEDGVD